MSDRQEISNLNPAKQEAQEKPRVHFGFLAGEIRIPSDFDRMDEAEIAALFGASGEISVLYLPNDRR